MSADQTDVKQKIFPGDTFLEAVHNEIMDVLWYAPFRIQFLVMGAYAVVMLIGYFLYLMITPAGVDIYAAAAAFFILAIFFIFSDFLKRKKLLPRRAQFWLDSFCFVSLMIYLVAQTGGQQSPLIFPLLFLVAVSAPLHGKTSDTIILISLISSAYMVARIVGGNLEPRQIFLEAMQALAAVVACISVKINILAHQKKVADNERLNLQQLELTKKLDISNQALESEVRGKTKDLRAALKESEKNEFELNREKRAIINILEDIAYEKNQSIIEQEKLSRILHSIGDAVLVIDSERRIILSNRAAETITGYLVGETVGRPVSEILRLVYERDRTPNNIIEEVFESGTVQEITRHTLLINKSNHDIPIADSAAPIKDGDGNIFGCIVVFRDVTHEREIDRQKSEFVSVASHQLRTPLTSIKWFLEMLLNGDAGKLNKEQEEMIQQVFDSGERMIALVNSLLNISRIEAGRVSVNPEPTDLNELINDVVSELKVIAEQAGVKLQNKVPKLPVIKIDKKLIREVFVNLLSNAIKYTPAEGQVSVMAETKQDDIIFSFADTGIGVPKAQQAKIFHKFFRAENAVVHETEGSGMGLYVAKNVVELSGGKIWFKSEEDKGSTFFFTLPLEGSKMIEGERTLV